MSSSLPKQPQPLPAMRDRQASLMSKLSREIDCLVTAGQTKNDKHAVSTGCDAMDALLPGGGYVPGSIVEYLRHAPASGATHLALLAARQAMKATGGFLVVVDHLEQIFPPKLQALGIDLKKVIFVRPASDVDAIWSVDQALRTPAVAAVFAEIPRLDDQAARRMQLAAERGEGLGLLVRSAAARKAPSWAEVQWLVRFVGRPRTSPLGDLASRNSPTDDRYLQMRLARAKGTNAGKALMIKISGTTGGVSEFRPASKAPNSRILESAPLRNGVA